MKALIFYTAATMSFALVLGLMTVHLAFTSLSAFSLILFHRGCDLETQVSTEGKKWN